MNVRTLKASELFQLASILYQCREKSIAAEKELNTVVEKIRGMSEDSYAFVWDRIPVQFHSTKAI